MPGGLHKPRQAASDSFHCHPLGMCLGEQGEGGTVNPPALGALPQHFPNPRMIWANPSSCSWPLGLPLSPLSLPVPHPCPRSESQQLGRIPGSSKAAPTARSGLGAGTGGAEKLHPSGQEQLDKFAQVILGVGKVLWERLWSSQESSPAAGIHSWGWD